jgi:hypothetical protein
MALARIQHRTPFGESTYPSWAILSVSLGFRAFPLFGYLWGSDGRGQFPSFHSAWVYFVVGLRDPSSKSPVPDNPQPPGPRSPTSHLNTMTTVSHAPCTVLRIVEPHGDDLRFHISFQLAPTMGATSSLPSDSPLKCLLNNLDTLGLTPDIKPKI